MRTGFGSNTYSQHRHINMVSGHTFPVTSLRPQNPKFRVPGSGLKSRVSGIISLIFRVEVRASLLTGRADVLLNSASVNLLRICSECNTGVARR